MADGGGPSGDDIRLVEERVTMLERRTKTLEKALARSASVSAYSAHALLSVTIGIQERFPHLTFSPDTIDLMRELKDKLADLVKAFEEAVDVE